MDGVDAFGANGNLLEDRAMRMARVRYDREMCYYHLMNRVAGEPGYYPFGGEARIAIKSPSPSPPAVRRFAKAGRTLVRMARGGVVAGAVISVAIEGYCVTACCRSDVRDDYERLINRLP